MSRSGQERAEEGHTGSSTHQEAPAGARNPGAQRESGVEQQGDRAEAEGEL